MSKYPAKLAERNRARPIREMKSDAVDVLAPTSRSSPLLSFRYSYTEMSVLDGKAQVKSRNARLENGKLTLETFEGELDQSAYDRAISDVQRSIGNQMAQCPKSFSFFLPFFRTHRPDRD
jgi:hypothetical protein